MRFKRQSPRKQRLTGAWYEWHIESANKQYG